MPNDLNELKKSADLAQKNKLDIPKAIDIIIPQAMKALDQIETIEEANEVRSRLQTIHTYIKRKLPGDRVHKLKKNNEWAKAYLTASRIAGAMWKDAEKFDGRPPEKREINHALKFTAQELGFADRFDARKCEKISLVNDQDFELYIKECNENGRQATLSGLVGIYDLINPKEDNEPATVSLYKRLSGTIKNLIKWKEEAEGDTKELIGTAIEVLSDAAEIEKDN